MRRWFVGLFSVMVLAAAFVAPPALANDSPIGHLGDTLRVTDGDIVADVTVLNVLPSDIPPGWGYPPRWPRSEVVRAQVAVTAVQVPASYSLSKLAFHGVTQTGDSYVARNTDAPDALRHALLNVPQGSTVGGSLWWDCYRDLISNVVLIDPMSGSHLAQWNI